MGAASPSRWPEEGSPRKGGTTARGHPHASGRRCLCWVPQNPLRVVYVPDFLFGGHIADSDSITESLPRQLRFTKPRIQEPISCWWPSNPRGLGSHREFQFPSFRQSGTMNEDSHQDLGGLRDRPARVQVLPPPTPRRESGRLECPSLTPNWLAGGCAGHGRSKT